MRYEHHGKSYTKLYQAWADMLQRCNNPSNARYKDYGARGITVCAAWQDFAKFRSDMESCPRGFCLDRRDNALGYTPENCRWISKRDSARNRTTSKLSKRKVVLIQALLKAINPSIAKSVPSYVKQVLADCFAVSPSTIYAVETGRCWGEEK